MLSLVVPATFDLLSSPPVCRFLPIGGRSVFSSAEIAVLLGFFGAMLQSWLVAGFSPFCGRRVLAGPWFVAGRIHLSGVVAAGVCSICFVSDPFHVSGSGFLAVWLLAVPCWCTITVSSDCLRRAGGLVHIIFWVSALLTFCGLFWDWRPWLFVRVALEF